MKVYGFNVYQKYHDPVMDQWRHVYGRYIDGKLWCVWFPKANDKAAHEALAAKEVAGSSKGTGDA